MSFGNSFSDFIRKFQVIQYQYFLIIFKPSKSAIFEKFWSCFRFPRCSMRDAFMHLSWICKNYATSAHLAFNIRYYNEFIIMFLALILFLLAQGWKGIRTEDASFWCTVTCFRQKCCTTNGFLSCYRTIWTSNQPGNKLFIIWICLDV